MMIWWWKEEVQIDIWNKDFSLDVRVILNILIGPPYLCEFLLFEWDLSIIADLPQGGTKAPLVSCDAQGWRILHTLWSNPWDTIYTLYRSKQSQLHKAAILIIEQIFDSLLENDWNDKLIIKIGGN